MNRSMAKLTVCDRCHKPYQWSDALAEDVCIKDFPGMDLCPDCALQGYVGESAGKQAALQNKTIPQVLEEWLKRYESED